MKFVRFFLWGAAGTVVILAICLGIISSSLFQTWAARRILAGHPEWNASVRRVSVFWGKARVEDFKMSQGGISVEIPEIDADLCSWRLLRGVFEIGHLRARGWTLDFTSGAKNGSSVGLTRRSETGGLPSLVSSVFASDAPPVLPRYFSGLLPALELPWGLSVQSAELQGRLLLPAAAGLPPALATATLTGGNIGVGREGTFALKSDITQPGDALIQTMRVAGSLALKMSSPRTFSEVSLRLDADASGTQMPQDAHLTLNARASSVGAGESYFLSLLRQEKRLLEIKAELPADIGIMSGSWSLNASEADVLPFSFGWPLPKFAAEGEGTFTSKLASREQVVKGRLTAALARLETLGSGWGRLGAVSVDTSFDLLWRGSVIRVMQLQASLSGARKIGAVVSRQGFEFDLKRRELKVADTDKDLLSIDLAALPLAWLQACLPDGDTLSGDDLSGAFAFTAHREGFALRSLKPLTGSNLSLSRAGKPLFERLNLSATLAGDYTPEGWQAEVSDLKLANAQGSVISMSARAGQLAQAGSAVKAAGQCSADLSLLVSQPFFAELGSGFSKGRFSGNFVANLADKKEVQFHLDASELEAGRGDAEKLPSFSADVRADVAKDGTITLQSPIRINNSDKQRLSDLLLSGTIRPGEKVLKVDAVAGCQLLVLDDLASLLAPFADRHTVPQNQPREKPTITPRLGQAVRDEAEEPLPFWSGLEGQVLLSAKKVYLDDSTSLSEVNGTLKADATSLRLDSLKASLDAGGSLFGDAALTFLPSKEPYILKSDLSFENIDAAALLASPSHKPPFVFDAKFNITSSIIGSGATLSELGDRITGSFRIISKGGTLRLLSLEISEVVKPKAPSTLETITAGLGSLIGKKSGENKDLANLDEYARLAAEAAQYCSAVSFDQLSFIVLKDAKDDLRLQDIAIISPQLRLSGTGEIRHEEGKELLDEPLDLHLQLGVHGKLAECFEKAGLLDGRVDNLGYKALSQPVRVGGTLGSRDLGEFKELLKRISSKSPDAFFDRILGGR